MHFTASFRELPRVQDGVAQACCPKGRRGAVGGTRDRIFKDGGLGGEEPGDEVDVLALGP